MFRKTQARYNMYTESCAYYLSAQVIYKRYFMPSTVMNGYSWTENVKVVNWTGIQTYIVKRYDVNSLECEWEKYISNWSKTWVKF